MNNEETHALIARLHDGCAKASLLLYLIMLECRTLKIFEYLEQTGIKGCDIHRLYAMVPSISVISAMISLIGLNALPKEYLQTIIAGEEWPEEKARAFVDWVATEVAPSIVKLTVGVPNHECDNVMAAYFKDNPPVPFEHVIRITVAQCAVGNCIH